MDVQYFTPSPQNYYPGSPGGADYQIYGNIVHAITTDPDSPGSAPIQLGDSGSTRHVKRLFSEFMSSTPQRPQGANLGSMPREPAASGDLVPEAPDTSSSNREDLVRGGADVEALNPLERRSNYISANPSNFLKGSSSNAQQYNVATSSRMSVSGATRNGGIIRSLKGSVWDSWGSGKKILENVLRNEYVDINAPCSRIGLMVSTSLSS